MTTDHNASFETGTGELNRTNLALDRTILANERTYGAWIRTGLTALAAGLGVAKFMIDELPLWSVRAIATVLMGFSAVAFLLAGWRYRHLHVKVAHLEVDAVPISVATGLSIVLAVTSIVTLACFWYMV